MPFSTALWVSSIFLGVFQSLVRFLKLEWEKLVTVRGGNAFPFMNLLVTPGGHQELVLWDLL